MSELKEMLNEAQDRLANGSPVDENDLSRMMKEYEPAIRNQQCPCESGVLFGDCCKMMWNALRRGVARQKQEAKTQRRDEVEEEQAPVRKDQPTWIVKVGTNPDGNLEVSPMGDLGKRMHPFSVAGLLLTAYHSIMAEHIPLIAAHSVKQMMKGAQGAKQIIPN